VASQCANMRCENLPMATTSPALLKNCSNSVH
jgi:hypothetical protein